MINRWSQALQSSPSSSKGLRHRRKPTAWTSSINWSLAKRKVWRRVHKQGGQRHHRHHPTNSWWQRPQKCGWLHLYEVMKAATKGAGRLPTNSDRCVGAGYWRHSPPIWLSKKGQCQHGADAIQHGTNGHLRNRHRHPTAHTHSTCQHRNIMQSQVWTWVSKNRTHTTTYTMQHHCSLY